MTVDEAAAVARAARSPNTGWAELCARAEATGVELDLADDALDLRGILVELRRALRIPRGCDTLCFEIGARGALRVTGLKRGVEVWAPPDNQVKLENLGAVRGSRALRFGAAALVARFAAEDLRQAVAVRFAGGEAVEVDA